MFPATRARHTLSNDNGEPTSRGIWSHANFRMSILLLWEATVADLTFSFPPSLSWLGDRVAEPVHRQRQYRSVSYRGPETDVYFNDQSSLDNGVRALEW